MATTSANNAATFSFIAAMAQNIPRMTMASCILKRIVAQTNLILWLHTLGNQSIRSLQSSSSSSSPASSSAASEAGAARRRAATSRAASLLGEGAHEVHRQRKDDGRVLFGGDHVERLQIAQLQRRRRLRDHVSCLLQRSRRLLFALRRNHLQTIKRINIRNVHPIPGKSSSKAVVAPIFRERNAKWPVMAKTYVKAVPVYTLYPEKWNQQ